MPTRRLLFSPAALPVLSFGCSGHWCSVGLLWPDPDKAGAQTEGDGATGLGAQSACASEQTLHGHAERLLPMADALLSQAGLTLSDVALIGLDAGPGSFTSLRIGCGLAQGLALGLGCPIVPVSSLRALAWPHRDVRCLTATDARMGEVYLAAWPPLAPSAADFSPALSVGPPAHLAAQIEQLAQAYRADCDAAAEQSVAPWVAAGDAFARYPEMADLARARGALVLPDAFPRADVIARIAATGWALGEAVAPDEAAPIYVRNKVALNVDEQRALRQARDAAR